MADDWESAADSELVIRSTIPANVNKWAGEDEPEDVKDNWEDEEEKKDEEKVEIKTVNKTKSSSKAKLILQQLEDDEKRFENMTPEEKLAEKLRLQKIQEEADLKTALETLGISTNGLDSFNPQTKEEFKEFGTTLSWKLSQYKDSPHFPQFVEDLVRSICTNLTLSDIKKVKISVESLHAEKFKLEKQNTKKTGKIKTKATIRADTDDIDEYKKYGNDYDTYDDDFM